MSGMEEQRIDKWLWCARLFKTRGLASDAVKTGRVTVNGVRAKPARTVRPGDAVMVRKPPFEHDLIVAGLRQQRVGAALVSELYVEHEASIAKRTALAATLSAAAGQGNGPARKPTRRERQARDRLKRQF
jgi:ribosome-associated heat shock protein Hsp15